METTPDNGTGLLFVVPAPMYLTRTDVKNILDRSHTRASGRSVYVVILCLDYEEDIVDLFDAFDGNVAITATTLTTLSDQERYHRLADRIVASTRDKTGIHLQNLDYDQGETHGIA